MKVLGISEGTEPFEHLCEVCGTTELLSSDQAHQDGWDYPPIMGKWGVVSSRTCPDCPMTETLWWALQQNELDAQDPMSWPERRRKTLARILSEENND